MKRTTIPLFCALMMGAFTANSYAWGVLGRVKCPDSTPVQGVVIRVAGTVGSTAFSGSAVTDPNGDYHLNLPDLPGNFTATLDLSSLPAGSSVTSPNPVNFETTFDDGLRRVDFRVDGAVCTTPPPPPAACWFTGGGAKVDPILGIPAAEKGTKNNFGGNVYPGCNSTSGDGGNWNHVARDLNLHFQGKSIQVVACGNVTPPPPPGSTSPVTPYNFIEFVGTGTLKGIQGNKADYGTVSFFARCEDRNEPGTKAANAGAGIDRYYLRVVDSTGTTRLLINGNADPNIVVPVEISGGNFQLHVSSCSNPPTP